MKIAFVAPSPVPFVVGGTEKLLLGFLEHINNDTEHEAELIKLPSPEAGFWEMVDSYRAFSRLDLSHFDTVVVSKYPSWMVRHPNKICYLQHKKHRLYEDYHLFRRPLEPRLDHPLLAGLHDFMERTAARRDSLTEFFARLDQIRERANVPQDTFDYPGPWLRAIVHHLDGVGLAAAEVRKYAAISRTVVQRDGYFPSGAPVQVIHHPSRLKPQPGGPGHYFFTASRLDKKKRLDLLIQAMRASKADIPLKIAGTGSMEAELREAAGNDPRIEFLGFRSDAELAVLYRDALAVPFLPLNEDYGLITIEAMGSGKPVITASDSGGPTELVHHGENGWIVPPQPAAIAERLEAVCRDREGARRMGAMAQRAVAGIHWKRTLELLLQPPAAPGGRPKPGPRRPKITVAVSYPVYPARSGGQARIFQLYRNVARVVDVELLTLSWPDKPALDEMLAPGLREIRLPVSSGHAEAEAKLTRSVNGVRIRNPAMPGLYKLTPAYSEALRRSSEEADLVVASGPFVLPALQEVTDKPLVYDAQNVEFDIKSAILPDNAVAQRLLAMTRQVEGDCLRRSHLVGGCSEADWERLQQLYGSQSDKFLLVANGADLGSVPFVPLAERVEAKRNLGFPDRFSALFMGSHYGPNLEAARRIIGFAESLPSIDFWLLGSTSLAFEGASLPANVRLLGVVDDVYKAALLGAADAALNPILAGSGTNLKMLDYCAAGLPVLTTPQGVRGLDLASGEHLIISELDGFAAALGALARSEASARAAMAVRARRQVERLYDWAVIAKTYLEGLKRRGLLAESVCLS